VPVRRLTRREEKLTRAKRGERVHQESRERRRKVERARRRGRCRGERGGKAREEVEVGEEAWTRSCREREESAFEFSG